MNTTNSLFSELTQTELAVAKVKGIIAGTITNKRNELGMNQKEFAEYMGVTQGMVSKWESCEYNFTIESAITIFDKLGLNFSIDIGNTLISTNAYLESRNNIIPYKNNSAFNYWGKSNINLLEGAV